MRRFAYMNFQFYTELDSKLSYTPCYGLVKKLFYKLKILIYE